MKRSNVCSGKCGLGLMAAALLLAACATRPENIKAADVSTDAYQGLSCEQLGQEEMRLNTDYTAAAAEQEKARKNDNAGVFLLGLPVGSLSGQDMEKTIATLKGQQGAVRQTQMIKNCPR